MARDIQLSVAGAQLAFLDAGPRRGRGRPDPDRRRPRGRPDLDRAGRTRPGDRRRLPVERAVRLRGLCPRGIGMITPIWLLKYLPNMLACHISILLDCQGPSNTITEAEAASNVAIGEAARIIARGRADVMITGGADSKIHPLSLVRMSLLDQMSHWSGEPSPGPAGRSTPPRWLGPGEGAGSSSSRNATMPWPEAPRSTARSSASARAATPARSEGSTPTGSAPRSPSGGPPRRQARAGPDRPRQRPRRRHRRLRPGRGPRHRPGLRRRRAVERRARHRLEGLYGQHRLGLRGGRADRQPARRQSRPDPPVLNCDQVDPAFGPISTW